jgi:PAS domain S-box-containing protein
MSITTQKQLREMNDALLVSSVHQHELTEIAEKATAEARESEARYRALFDLGPVAVYACDVSGVVHDFNSRAVELWGRQPGSRETEARFCGSLKMFRPDGSLMPHDQCPMAEVASGKVSGVRDSEVVIERPDGSRVTVVVNIRQLKNERGEVTGAINCFYDVTERKRAETSIARLAAIVESSDDAIISKDLNGTIKSWNRGAERLFGYAAEEVIGKSVTLLIPPDHVDEEAGILERLRRGESVEHYETVRRRKDGSLLDISLTISPIRDAQGRVIGASKVARDITEHRRMEAAVLDSEVRYRRLFTTAMDGIIVLDAHNGRIIDANAYMCGLLGLEAAELRGKELWEIGLFKDIEENKAAFQRLQQDRFLRYDHLPIQNRRGESIAVEFVSNVYQEGPRLVAQCNVRNISDRVAMEKKITEQTQALADESRRKDEFLAMLSHELRNPLAPIRSAAHLLRLQERGSENPIQAQAREISERQVTNLTRLVRDLLEISRVVTGRIRLDRHTVDMNEIVRHAVETSRPLIEQRRHQLTINLCSQPVWVYADATRMEEVLTNLLNNAAKYTPDGGKIEVDCQHHQNHALLRIRDNGVGIDEKLLPRIFELFTQADRSLDRAAGGLGIGLSLAHRLVGLHGGTIEANSEGLGRGSEFIVKLPIVPEPAAPGEGEPAASEPTAHASTDDSPRVLVVDDNTDSCMMLAYFLREKGYGVQTAHTGPDAVRVATQWRPDIALLDIGLPGLDGYEVARRLRADRALKHTRLVALTGYGSDSDIRLAREAGFDAHLLKPFELDEVERMFATPK